MCCDDSVDKLFGCKTTMKNSNFCADGQDQKFNGVYKYTKCAFDIMKCGNP